MQVLLSAGTVSGLSDGELLTRFLGQRDEAAELAFAVLVERHGPMVLGVCRRILCDPHDAEDAFQATFLVLARKGRSVRVEGSLGRWLFGVAARVATRARSDRGRRARERTGLDRVEAARLDESLAAVDRAEFVAAVTSEIARLPGRFQVPVLLCDLEGTSCEEAARRLGWPIGTVKSRLSRARARLRERLTRRGLTPADLSFMTIRLPAALSPRLVEATTRAALGLGSGNGPTAAAISASVACLTQGVLRTMLMTRIKCAAASLLLVAIGSAALFGQASALKPQPAGNGRASATAATGTGSKTDDQIDLEMLERAWADAIARSDTAVVNRILADEFQGSDQAGDSFDKPAALHDLAKGSFQNISSAALEQVDARVIGETGVVTGRFKVRDSSARGLLTHVYARRRGRWQCIGSHASWSTRNVCYGIGPIADVASVLNSAVAQGYLRHLTGKAAECAACHVVTRGEAQPPFPPPGDGKGRPGQALHVEIDAAGHITIEGKPVAAEKKALEERLGIGKAQTGRDDVIVSASEEAPYWVVAMVATAAQSVGLHHLSFTGRENEYHGKGGR
jgi:RNA polymerase sigma factor (sigma-70 family)